MSWSKRSNTIQLTEFLKEFRNKRVLYFPNSGNAGDSLIAAASMQLFRRLNIYFEPIQLETDVSNEIVILGGGGNFIPLYETIRNALLHFKTAKQIVLLPHTIRGNEDVLQDLGSNVTLFCRDAPSYRHLHELNLKSPHYLAHDMAFHLDPEALLFSDDAPSFQKKYAEALQKNNIDLQSISVKREVYLTRGDGESTGKIGRCDADISELFAFGVWPGNAECSSWCFLESIRCVDKVVTDRLHVGIACALLGRSCTLYDNSYGKNKAVYQHSLRFYTDAVEFVE